MNSRYIPKGYTEREVGAEERLAALALGGALLSMGPLIGPLYAAKGISGKIKEYFSRRQDSSGRVLTIPESFDEYLDTLNRCWSCGVEGRLPEDN